MNDITSGLNSKNEIILTKIDPSGVITTITFQNDPLIAAYILEKFIQSAPESVSVYDNKTSRPEEPPTPEDSYCFVGDCNYSCDS